MVARDETGCKTMERERMECDAPSGLHKVGCDGMACRGENGWDAGNAVLGLLVVL